METASWARVGRQCTGYAVVTLKRIVEALPPGSSAQGAEIIALTRALLLAEGKGVKNILILAMHSPCCMLTGKSGKKGSTSIATIQA